MKYAVHLLCKILHSRTKGRAQDFSLGQDRRVEGRERGGVLGEGQQPISTSYVGLWELSSVQFAKINVVLSGKHFRTTTQ